eukprot:COSAG03_NODE_17788_length_368_cov_0.698885_1_plen_79_part_01
MLGRGREDDGEGAPRVVDRGVAGCAPGILRTDARCVNAAAARKAERTFMQGRATAAARTNFVQSSSELATAPRLIVRDR